MGEGIEKKRKRKGSKQRRGKWRGGPGCEQRTGEGRGTALNSSASNMREGRPFMP